jgi:outer membrane biosynthesis protein TonB
MVIQVVPTPLTPTPPTICGFNYNVNALQLNSFITFNVILLDANSIPLQVKQVTLAGQDYELWGNSDQYVINYICNALGLTQFIPEPVVEPTVEPVVEPTVEPVVEPIVEPVVEPVVEPTVEPVVEPTVEPSV